MEIRRVVFPERGRVEVESVPFELPADLAARDGLVLVETIATLVNPGSELAQLDGGGALARLWPGLSRYPIHPGFGGVGRVVESLSESGRSLLGRLVVGQLGHSSHCLIRDDRLSALSSEIALGQSTEASNADLLDALASAHFAAQANQAVPLDFGSRGRSVAVIGGGLLGQIMLRLLLARSSQGKSSAAPLLVEPIEPRRELARSVGAISLSPAEAEGASPRDIVFETSGTTSGQILGLSLVRDGGEYFALGLVDSPQPLDLSDILIKRNIILRGHLFGGGPTDPRYAAGLRLWLSPGETTSKHASRKPVSGLVSRRLPWYDAATAYSLLRERKDEILAVLLHWSVAAS